MRVLNLVLASVLAASVPMLASAQAPSQESAWRSFISVSPVFEEADLDSGGSARVGGVINRLGTSTGFGDGHRAGVTVNYDYYDYSFDNPVAFGGVAPWNILQRYGFSVPLTFALRDGWSVGVAPAVDWFLENGAKSSEALVWGATFTAAKRYDGGNILGLGLTAFSQIEQTSVVPFFIVNWQFNKNWKLINPLAAGPTGPAGLELDYLFDNGWTLGVGAAWRKSRWRLSEDGPVANGVGEIRGAPIFLRASREFARTYTLNLYAGVVAAGELRVEDSSGNLLRKEEFDLAPILGFNVTARF